MPGPAGPRIDRDFNHLGASTLDDEPAAQALSRDLGGGKLGESVPIRDASRRGVGPLRGPRASLRPGKRSGSGRVRRPAGQPEVEWDLPEAAMTIQEESSRPGRPCSRMR